MVTTGAEAARPGNLVTCAVRVSERGGSSGSQRGCLPSSLLSESKSQGNRVVTAAGEEMQVRVGGAGRHLTVGAA